MYAAARRRRIRNLGLAFGGLVAAMAAVVAIVWVNVDLIQRAGNDVAEAQGELAWADATLDAASDQKNALAGILATHDPRYVTPFEQGRRRFEHAMERLTAYSGPGRPSRSTPRRRRRHPAGQRPGRSRSPSRRRLRSRLAAFSPPPSRPQLESMDQVAHDIDDLRDGESRLAARRQLALASAYRTTPDWP